MGHTSAKLIRAARKAIRRYGDRTIKLLSAQPSVIDPNTQTKTNPSPIEYVITGFMGSQDFLKEGTLTLTQTRLMLLPEDMPVEIKKKSDSFVIKGRRYIVDDVQVVDLQGQEVLYVVNLDPA